MYSISCESVRSYIGKTGRPVAVRLRERRHNVKEVLEKPKLAKYDRKWVRKVIREVKCREESGSMTDDT
jgi:uncharacterized protein (UPF0335 family)